MATTYYVDATGGLDTYDGLAESWDGIHGPWQTLTKVTNVSAAGTFLARDTIKFKRGETFTGYLNWQSSGDEGKPITLTDYGSGDLPYFGSGHFKTWYVSHLRINNIHTNSTVVNYGMVLTSGHDIIVNSCYCEGNDASHTAAIIIDGGTTYGWSYNITIKNCEVTNFIGGGVSILSYCRDITVENNFIHNGGGFGIQFLDQVGWFTVPRTPSAGAPYNCIARNNKIHDITLYSSDYSAVNFGYACYNSLAENNYSYSTGNGIGNDINAHDNIVRNNIITECTNIPVGCATDTSNIKMYNNTIICSKYNKGLVIAVSVGGGIEFKNNIIYNSDSTSIFIWNMGLSTFESDYNMFYDSSGNTIYNFKWNGVSIAPPTLANWKSTSSADTNSTTSDPLFRSSTDYHLTKNSPVKTSGIALPEVREDYDGNPRPLSGGCSMGAFQWNKAIIRGNTTIKNATL